MVYSSKRYYDNILTFGRKRLGLYLIVVVVYLLSCVLLFSDSMDYSLPGFSLHGVFQARILEWLSLSF